MEENLWQDRGPLKKRFETHAFLGHRDRRRLAEYIEADKRNVEKREEKVRDYRLVVRRTATEWEEK